MLDEGIMSPFEKICSVFVLLACSCLVSADSSPRLVILLAVDQLRADRLDPKLPGGLGRLAREGLRFTNAMLDHGVTNTCPGHVAFATGVNPGRAGIPGNDYIDPETFEERYCVEDQDDRFAVFGVKENRSPRSISVTALGDWLKAGSPGSRVIAISAKDRAAITLGGQDADAAYWFNRDAGRFTSSRYYMNRLPDWLMQFNGNNFFTDGAAGDLPVTWAHGPGSVRPDDFPGEKTNDGRVSGHALNQGTARERAERLYYSAYMDELTMKLVSRVIKEESLGLRGVTDLLALSMSSVDTVGHRYGPYSAESEDTLQRLDQLLGELLDRLDTLLGGDYVIALTADHGVLPLPEWLEAQSSSRCPVSPGRVTTTGLGLRAYTSLYLRMLRPFANITRLVGFSDVNIYVNEPYAQTLGLDPALVVKTVANYLEGFDYVAEAWTPDELQATRDPIARLYRNSYVPGKSGQIYLQVEPDCLIYDSAGTSHISPYDYDRRVPMLFFGRDIEAGIRAEAVYSIDIAPTLGRYLQLPLPGTLDGRQLGVFQQGLHAQ